MELFSGIQKKTGSVKK